MTPQFSKTRRRLLGLVALLGGAAGTVWLWDTAPRTGQMDPLLMTWFPVMAVLGVGYLLFPGYTEERVSRGEDVSRLSLFQFPTPRWWVIFGVALAAAFANHLLVHSTFAPPPGVNPPR